MKRDKKPVLCIDFDGTICEHNYPAIGEPLPGAFETLKEFTESGDRLILWTCREGIYLDEAISFCKENGIEFETHNQNVKEHDYAKSRKAFAHMYIDDRMPGGFPGWAYVNERVKELRKTLLSL